MKSEPNDGNKGTSSMPIWLMATILITLTLGFVLGFILNNLLSAKQIIFSTASVISFVFAVSLGAASIVLAIITIVLSRSAEGALIRRSDEGIRLQSDVFVRTNEVLSKIQTSTGVTEKRIEDIILGRTALIVQAQAQEMVDKSTPVVAGWPSSEIMEWINKKLAESFKPEFFKTGLMTSVLVANLAEKEAKKITKMKRKAEIYNKWKEFRTIVVAEACGVPGVQILSEIEGKLSAENSKEFWDAVAVCGGKRYALDLHTREQIVDPASSFRSMISNEAERSDYSRRISWRVSQDDISVLVLMWDEDVAHEYGVQDLLSALRKANPIVEIRLLHGKPKEIALTFICT